MILADVSAMPFYLILFLRLNTFIEDNTCMYVKKW